MSEIIRGSNPNYGSSSRQRRRQQEAEEKARERVSVTLELPDGKVRTELQHKTSFETYQYRDPQTRRLYAFSISPGEEDRAYPVKMLNPAPPAPKPLSQERLEQRSSKPANSEEVQRQAEQMRRAQIRRRLGLPVSSS